LKKVRILPEVFMRKADRIVSIMFILGSIFMLHETSQIEKLRFQILSSKMFPQLVFVVMILLGILLFIQTFMHREAEEKEGDVGKALIRPKRLMILGLFVAYLLIMPIVGFIETTAVFAVVAMMSLSPQRKKDLPVSLLISGGLVGLIYLVFDYWLQVFLP
jgi:putative tricarboxylic transport membrane protein